MGKFLSKSQQEIEPKVTKTVKFKKEKSAIDSYYRLITKIFLVIGFDFDGKYQNSKMVSFGLKLIKLINMICIFLATFQCLTYFFTENLSDVGTLGSGTFGLYSVQTIVKIFVYFAAIDKFHQLTMDVIETYGKFKPSENDDKFFTKAYKYCPKIFFFNVFNLLFYSLTGLVRIIVAKFTGTSVGSVFPYEAFWSFDPYEYLPWTLFYNAYTNVMTDFVSMICEQLFVFVVSHMIVSFERLEDEVDVIIQQIDTVPADVIKSKLPRCIDLHNELIGHSKVVNSLFGISLLGFLIQSYWTICYLIFLTTSKFSDFAILSAFALVNVSVQILMLAYFAEKLKEKVRKTLNF